MAQTGFLRGLVLAVVGTFVKVLFTIFQSSGIDGLKIALLLLAFALGWIPRIPVVAIIVGCGLVGLLAGR